jgi:acetylcholinesterase
MGVLHGDEVEYVFGHPTKRSSRHTDKEKELSYRIMNYFATFARTG